ncbi:MAG: nucleotide exchange factor GrpE [Acidimicrobiia bacterium]|nr:nucleotide exchange factor GrpE [Acidimicrobiia bacterium]
MSAASDPQPDAPAGPDRAEPGAAEPEPGPFDAAEAAGFGGITWADEADGEPAGDEAPDDEPDRGADQAASDDADPAEPPSAAAAGGPPTNGGSPDNSAGGDRGGAGVVTDDISVEDLVQDLERVTTERDQYLDASRRLQAEFENYRKAVAKRELEARERANESLVSELLPVLDACDAALASGATDVEPVRASLIDALTKQGLARIDDADAPFDPERHDAVMHEPDEGGDGPIVAEVMRAGYSWKGRVVRPAMVRVRG